MDRWEQRHLRRILREELHAALDAVMQPVVAAMLLAARQNTPGACGTAREAPTVSSSGDTIDAALDASRDTVSAPIATEIAGDISASPALGGAAKAVPPKRRPRVKESAPIFGTDRAGGLGKDDVAPRERHEAGGAASRDGMKPASIVTAHPSVERIPMRPRPTPRPSPLVRTVALDPNRPIAASREGCARCATRGDIGCEHQRPFGTLE